MKSAKTECYRRALIATVLASLLARGKGRARVIDNSVRALAAWCFSGLAGVVTVAVLAVAIALVVVALPARVGRRQAGI